MRQFPGRSLPVELAEFSFPTQLRETQNILLQPEKQVGFRLILPTNSLNQHLYIETILMQTVTVLSAINTLFVDSIEAHSF